MGAGLLVYWQSLGNEFVRWDDGLLITENPIVRGGLSSLPKAFTTFDPELYIPLTFLSYKLDFVLGGIDPFFYHLQSLLLHVLNAVLVTVVLKMLFRRDWIAIGLGLLFLLHPLHVEAVAWASGRKDVLSTAFALLSVLAYLVYRRDGSRAMYWWSVGLFAAGLASKVMVITLPLLLLLIDEWTERPRTKAMLRDKLPYLALSVLFGLIAVFGKTTVLAESTLPEKILMAGRSAVFYVWTFVTPVSLSVLYPHEGAISFSDWAFLLPLLAAALLTVGSLWITWKRRHVAGVGIGFLFYLIAVSPTFTNFAKGDGDFYIASDRYAYLPSIGFLLILGLLLLKADKLLALWRAGIVFLSVCVAACAWLAHKQSLVWKDTETLFSHVAALQPRSYIAHANLANAHRRAGRDDEAVEEFLRSLSIRPHAKTEANLGAVYRKQRRYQDALDAYARALKIDPGSKEAHFGLGIVHAERGHLAEAEEEYRTAVELDPFYGEAWTNLGSLLSKTGKADDAADAYRRAIAADPWLADARYNLGVLEMKRGRNDEAIQAFRETIAVDPGYIAARLNLGVLLFNSGEPEQAKAQFERVLRLDPQNAAAKQALSQIR